MFLSTRTFAAVATTVVSLLSLPATAQSTEHHPVLMISIDGMRPDYVTEADKHGLKLPVLTSFIKDGTYATGVVNVVPTMTYPNHTTLVTGVWPNEHGIYNNTVFDPMGKEQGGWNWYGPAVKVPTLWQAAKAAGLVTASVYWPVTVHSSGIDYNIPEFFRARTAQDRYLMEALSYPSGFLEEIEKTAGPFTIRNSDIVFDETVTKTAIAVIEQKHPDFMTVHIVSLDHVEHGTGPFSPQANADIEKIDGLVGRLMDAERKAHPNADVVIVSDHGFLPITHKVNLNAAFVTAGLITVSQTPKEHVTAWKAFVWEAGGSAAVILHNPKDTETQKKVEDLLNTLAKDPVNGIARIVPHDEAVAMGATSDAAFLVDWNSGYRVAEGLTTPVVQDIPLAGTHGYLPTHKELHSSFFIQGPQIAHGKNLGTIDMRQIAPTIASELGASLPTAKMQPVAVKR